MCGETKFIFWIYGVAEFIWICFGKQRHLSVYVREQSSLFGYVGKQGYLSEYMWGNRVHYLDKTETEIIIWIVLGNRAYHLDMWIRGVSRKQTEISVCVISNYFNYPRQRFGMKYLL